MAKSSRSKRKPRDDEPDLFGSSRKRLRRSLILPHALEEEAEKAVYRTSEHHHAWEIVKHWADLERDGHLNTKETSLDASFLQEVFGKALGYTTSTESPQNYTLQRNFTVPGIGTADGAIGHFGPGASGAPVAVIELKAASADLDTDRFNGRTAVQQCWDYLNALPDCPWGIVSNFISIRLYHRDKTPLVHEEFSLQDLRETREFRRFFCLFDRNGLLRSNIGQPPRAMRLLEMSDEQRLEVGDKLYAVYSGHRLSLIRHLRATHGKSRDAAIRIAQKLLDRIIFIAFCEQRGLLPDKSLDRAYATIPPFSKVTNPRWRNFLDLFAAIDTGHDSLDLKHGYNGGLFRHDPEVDDLQLTDDWTEFFHEITAYDFNNEVNVDVLGHIFERSIGDLKRLRSGGWFDDPADETPAQGVMPKSAERKRSGIYYTPPDFTRFLVHQTVSVLVKQRREALLSAHGLRPEDLLVDEPSAKLRDYWRACWNDLRSLKLCDPACGSGAFLIAAYDVFEDEYVRVADHRRTHEGPEADALLDVIPNLILTENLHGVDLSEQSVEIAQLALWIRSARRGKTLADLSRNVLQGNSLASADLPHAFDWKEAFPAVFGRDASGFDCVVGNPPWERLKLQEREFFADSAPEIAGAVSAATRRTLLAKLETTNPTLLEEYRAAKQSADQMLDYARLSGRYPLTGQGDINTYMLFAELARSLVAPRGRVGLLVPSGIATDHTTKEFFGDLIQQESLIGLYDFENRKKVFPDVDGRFKFCTLVLGGSETRAAKADFVFFAHDLDDVRDKKRHIALSAKDLALLNPNTRTCPIFRSRRDAELTKAIYHRVPILVDESRAEGGNPWGVKYVRMFDQTNDADHFHDPEALRALGLHLDGNRWVGKGRTFLPLYEAKMIQAYDHRAASVVLAEGNWVRQGQTEATSLVEHQNPEFVVQPRWWVEESQVDLALGGQGRSAYLCYKDVTSATNERTVIAAMVPHVALVNSAPVLLTGEDIEPRLSCCLLANLNSLCLDYVARQKVGGNHLNYFLVNQFPIFPPEHYAQKCPWDRRTTLERWISERVLQLSCTANDMRPLAESAGFASPVHKWLPDDRAALTAELDAAYFQMYGMNLDDVKTILATFRGMTTGEGESRTFSLHANRILGAFARLCS